MENEIWKVFAETNSNRLGHRVYEVSNYGNVKINGEIVDLSKYYPYYKFAGVYIHRAVAKLFIPNPDNKPEVDHIDTNKANNRVDNLRWVTRKENNNNTLTKQHFSESQMGHNVTSETKLKLSIFWKGKRKGINGHIQTNQTRKSISETLKGYIWVNIDNKNKRIWPNELNYYLNLGYKRGMVSRKNK